MSTPFDPSSVQYLVENFEMPFLKISSGDLTNPVMLMAAARSGLSVVLSTGMSDLDEVKSALGVLAYALSRSSTAPSGRSEFAAAFDTDDARARLKKKVILLHCTTEYPAPIKDVNLRVMQTMRDTFAVPVGYSDHTIGTNVPIAAAALGAAVVEKHFTLDRTLPGPDHAASLEPDELKSMVSGIREVNQAMGSPEKSVAKSEEENLSVARKSLVAASPIRAGEPLTEQNLTIKRPGNGVSPMEYFDRLGSTADRDYEAEDLIH
jgi:sialic acid synthase SpsE